MSPSLRGHSATMIIFDELSSIGDRIMIGEIHVGTTYLTHEGGTKFYEVVCFSNPDAKKFVLVKRWGKMALRDGGGESKVETYATARKLDDAYQKAVDGKRARGYQVASTSHGFHALGVSYRDADEFYATLKKHYTTGTHIHEILTGMGIGELDGAGSAGEENEIVSETPEPEPERDDNYGSW